MGGGGSLHSRAVVGGQETPVTPTPQTPSPPLSVTTLPEDLLPSSSTPAKTGPRVDVPGIRMSAATPKGDAQMALTPFYCPICMLYLSEILVTTCCAHNICEPCLEACQGHRTRVAGDNNLHAMTCPHCASSSFHVTPLEDGALSRSYHSNEGPAIISGEQQSPLKIGASFDELRRKLRPFQVSTQQQGSVVTRYVTQVLEIAVQSFIAKTR